VQTREQFFWLGGRRHVDATYPLPKDLGEVNRLDFQHFVLRNGFGGNYLAPVVSPHEIMDVGCGTGRWAMELAALFPEANVIGVDIVTPAVDREATLGTGLDRRPPNYAYVQANVLEGLPFAERSFDFVHQRLLITAIPRDRWPYVVAELKRITRPGGWVELAEPGYPQHAGPGLTNLWDSWVALCALRKADFRMGPEIGDILETAGLRPVMRHVGEFPMGVHGGRLGQMSATDCLATADALRGPTIGAGVLSAAEYDRLVEMTRAEVNDPRSKAVLPFYLACGKRTV
ncbi:MAG TPA: class I SAM-dependent methyltransferase, partial [Ktedonobacterales bacterium]|nr:class I SAM-dependent methyltransferase [Ktedonobacterales bacterium]